MSTKRTGGVAAAFLVAVGMTVLAAPEAHAHGGGGDRHLRIAPTDDGATAQARASAHDIAAVVGAGTTLEPGDLEAHGPLAADWLAGGLSLVDDRGNPCATEVGAPRLRRDAGAVTATIDWRCAEAGKPTSLRRAAGGHGHVRVTVDDADGRERTLEVGPGERVRFDATAEAGHGHDHDHGWHAAGHFFARGAPYGIGIAVLAGAWFVRRRARR